MASPDDLQRAGQRPAGLPVDLPARTTVTATASARRRRRRVVAGTTVAGLVMLAAVPIGAWQLRSEGETPLLTGTETSETDSVTDEGTGEPAPSTDATPPAGRDEPATVDVTDFLPGDDNHFGAHLAEHELELTFGADGMYRLISVGGEKAADAAAEAESSADETRDLDGLVVWIEREGERSVASTLVWPEMFVSLTGPTDEIDDLLDMVTGRAFPLGGRGFDFDLDLDSFPMPERFGDLDALDECFDGWSLDGHGSAPLMEDLDCEFFDELFDDLGRGFLLPPAEDAATT